MLLAVLAGVMRSCGDKGEQLDSDDISSSNQLLLGYKEIGEVKYDHNTLKKNIMNDERFFGYGLRDEYCMVYQATDRESEYTVKGFLGIKEDFPTVDYSNYYVLFSIGRSIEDISDKNKKTTEDGEKIVNFKFSEEYSKNTVYVYSMKKTKFLSGTMLEIYYLENIHQYCNLEEVSRDNSQLISEGKYHKVYKKAEDVYEYVIYSAEEQKVSSRKILNTLPTITEYNDSMVKLEYEGKDQYYNPQTDFYTTQSKYPLHYLHGNIIVFAKFSTKGKLGIVVRDVYNQANYSHILLPTFTCGAEAVISLIKSVEYVDSTHIKISLYFGEEIPLKVETITVPNLDKKPIEE